MLCYVLPSILTQAKTTVIVISLQVPRIPDGLMPVRWKHEFGLRAVTRYYALRLGTRNKKKWRRNERRKEIHSLKVSYTRHYLEMYQKS